ncbi:MAG: tetratricopeptide repeat protein [Bacteroidales bacterium]
MKRRKRLFPALIVGLIVMAIASCSDKMYVNRAITWAEDGERLDTALKSVEKATKMEETKDWPKTYYARGYVYQSIYESDDSEFNDLVEDPLFKAFDQYKKAYEMDEEDQFTGNIDAAMFNIHKYFIEDGVEAFKDDNYEGALNNFEYALKVSDMPIFEGQVDTAIMFNAGIAAQNMKEWETAARHYDSAAKYDYGEERTYLLLNNAYFEAGDTTKGVEALKKGFEKYPSNEDMLASLINYYLLESDNPEEALKYVQEAQNQFPDNPQYFAAEGQIYDQMDENEKAKEKYKQALERDPELHMALYNLGVLYFNEGVDLVTKANEVEDDDEYKELRDKANEYFKEAMPYMEKALEIKPQDTNVLSTLRTLYYRLRSEDEKYVKKYKEVNQKLEQLEDTEDEGEQEEEEEDQ